MRQNLILTASDLILDKIGHIFLEGVAKKLLLIYFKMADRHIDGKWQMRIDMTQGLKDTKITTFGQCFQKL